MDINGKVYFRSQILVHEYWTILNHVCVPVLCASGCHQHILENINITFLGNTGTPEMFQYSSILECSSIFLLKDISVIIRTQPATERHNQLCCNTAVDTSAIMFVSLHGTRLRVLMGNTKTVSKTTTKVVPH